MGNFRVLSNYSCHFVGRDLRVFESRAWRQLHLQNKARFIATRNEAGRQIGEQQRGSIENAKRQANCDIAHNVWTPRPFVSSGIMTKRNRWGPIQAM